MIKRLSATLALSMALVLSTGAGIAGAQPGNGHGRGSGHAHGFQACMAAAQATYKSEVASGVSRAEARQHRHDAQAKCRSDFPSPRGK